MKNNIRTQLQGVEQKKIITTVLRNPLVVSDRNIN